MKRLRKQLIYSLLVGYLIISCQNNSNTKKVEPISTENLAKEIKGNLPAPAVSAELPGKDIYNKYCLTCHQADGSGVPNMHPPLGPGSWVDRDPIQLIAILMKGLSGKVEVNGEVYNNFMPSQAKLTNQEMADVLTYIRGSFGNNLEPVSVDVVDKIRSGK